MIEKQKISIGEGKRKASFDKLEHFLMNPGRFSMLVIGGRGVGKRTALEYCYKQAFVAAKTMNEPFKKSLCLTEPAPLFIEPNVVPADVSGLDTLMKKWHHRTIILPNVDKLSKDQQATLFEAMSTSNGKFGISSKEFDVRMVFTSTKPVHSLREDGKYLNGVFWDRISQLVVELPDYQKDPRTILGDFRCTWEKMTYANFEGIGKLADFPRNTILEGFLEESASELSGGFRDLDKIAVLYFNYRLLYYGDDRIVFEEKENVVAKSTRDDFWSLQLKSKYDDGLVNFRMDSKPSWPELHKAFKIQFRSWAQSKFGSLGEVEKKLGIPYDTLKDFTERGLNR